MVPDAVYLRGDDIHHFLPSTLLLFGNIKDIDHRIIDVEVDKILYAPADSGFQFCGVNLGCLNQQQGIAARLCDTDATGTIQMEAPGERLNGFRMGCRGIFLKMAETEGGRSIIRGERGLRHCNTVGLQNDSGCTLDPSLFLKKAEQDRLPFNYFL